MRRARAVGGFLKSLLIALWLWFLRRAISFHMPFLALAALGAGACLANAFFGAEPDARTRRVSLISGCVFSFFSLLGNYECFAAGRWQSGPLRAAALLASFAGGAALMREAIVFLSVRFSRETPPCRRGNGGRAFLVFFALLAGCNLTVMFMAYYPGILSYDSIHQLWEILSGQIQNDHYPYFYTQLLRLLFGAGLSVFGNRNAAVACCSVFQILCVAAAFAYALTTLHEAGAPRFAVALSLLWYASMPYHILYSFTMWKDVLYAAAGSLLLTAAYRLLTGAGSEGRDRLLLTLGILGMCLFRKNGFLACALSALALFGRLPRARRLFPRAACALAAGFFLSHLLPPLLGARGSDAIEALSIPLQQISRVVAEEDDLTGEERALLAHAADVSKIPSVYKSTISDPMKELVRKTGDQAYLSSHAPDYLRLWLALGLRHHKAYVLAWVDQTRGFWNGGYDYIYAVDVIVSQGSVGLTLQHRWPWLSSRISAYMWRCIERTWFGHPLQLCVSMGLYLWVLFACAAARFSARKNEALLFLPAACNLLTLLVSTPVYCEFRYNYLLFAAFPLMLVGMLSPAGMIRSPAETNRLKSR